jgi:enoyl-CoA hydratase
VKYENLRYERDGAVATLTVSRPKVLNALNRATLGELLQAVSAFRHDPEARVLILTGAGDKAFVAGADIAEMAALSRSQAEELARQGQRLTTEIEAVPKPVIAAVNGYALGGGCELAMACDLIFASENARFGQPEVNLGLLPGFGGTQRLARLVGRTMARQLVFTGETVTAQRAAEIGLVNAVYASERLLEATREVARLIASRGPLAVGAAKRAINQGVDLALEPALALEAMLFGALFDTADMREGTRAFLDKRQPAFRGQ